MPPAYLRYYRPHTHAEVGGEITEPAEVERLGDLALAEHAAAGVGYLPGLTLWRDADTPEDSLGICVAADGWALIHTDDDLFQQVTRGGRAPDGTRRRVAWDDFLTVPTACFLDRGQAVAAIRLWWRGGDVRGSGLFSNDLDTA
ncbi:hypothetical protein ACFQY4_22920 [Catellatospora bangladeshensis]|uniref:Uncharacterized protein n=1 Tax=Catellatospora bangladeshensis TaxID=310355 RepID=A0A8J3JGP3_9ACTN|nr:hypothetical protein [Catellatospora bangladeshensis]GIF80348.1 hypothetical protein Cba03nite_16970 [Catellatospora bangladeshensis]